MSKRHKAPRLSLHYQAELLPFSLASSRFCGEPTAANRDALLEALEPIRAAEEDRRPKKLAGERADEVKAAQAAEAAPAEEAAPPEPERTFTAGDQGDQGEQPELEDPEPKKKKK